MKRTADDRADDLVSRIASQWVPIALVGCAFGFMVVLGTAPISNPDTFFHLVVGERFLDDWSLRNPGTLTPFASGHWLPTQWLPEVIMAKFESWFGLGGVAFLSGVQLTAFVTTLIACGRRFADLWVVAPLTLLVILGSAGGLSMRPQVISYILCVVVAATWLSHTSAKRAPWMLIPLTWVWAMCHGMWPLSIAISGAAVVGIALDRKETPRRLLALASIPLLSLAAGLLTPVGPSLFSAVTAVNSRRHYFAEWDPPFVMTPQVAASYFIVAVAAVAMWRAGTITWTRIALMCFTCFAAVYSARTVPIASGIGMLLACIAVQGYLGQRSHWGRLDLAAVAVAPVVTLATILGVVAATETEVPSQPEELVELLDGLPAGTEMWTAMEYGGFMLWRYPNIVPTTMGYADQYTDDELATIVRIGRVNPGWSQDFSDFGVSYALIHYDDALRYNLTTFLGWTTLYMDPDVVLLSAPE